jgi:zinc protease
VQPPVASKPTNLALETPDKANAVFAAGKTLQLNDDAPDYPALVLANYMLGGGFLNSRLATRIRQKDGLSYGVGSQFSAEPLDSSATFLGYAIYAPENRDKVEKAFNEEMVRAAKDGFTADEIAKAKAGWMESRKVGRAEDAMLAGSLAAQLFLGRSFSRQSIVEAKVNALTAEQLQAVVAKYLDPATMVVIKAGDFAKKLPGPIKP